MSIPIPCYRHGVNVWIAYCPDCTAWHLPIQIGRRTTDDFRPELYESPARMNLCQRP